VFAGTAPHLAANQAKIIAQQEKIYELREQGKCIREIAREMGLSKGTVQNRLDDEWIRRIGPLSDKARERQLARVAQAEERIIAEKDAIEVGDNPDAIARLTSTQVGLWAQEAKLLGLFAPDKLQVSGDVAVELPPGLRAAVERAEADLAKREEEIRARADGD
jgi:predicted transcriptional regulator